MGLLGSGQSTVPHITFSDLLSTDLLVSPSGAVIGAGHMQEKPYTWMHLSITPVHVVDIHTCWCGDNWRGDCVTAAADTKYCFHTDTTVVARNCCGYHVSSQFSINNGCLVYTHELTWEGYSVDNRREHCGWPWYPDGAWVVLKGWNRWYLRSIYTKLI